MARDDPELLALACGASSRACLCAASLRSAIAFLRSLNFVSDAERPACCDVGTVLRHDVALLTLSGKTCGPQRKCESTTHSAVELPP